MNFIPLASSSKGNAYLLTAEGASPLLLEAGLPIKRLRDKLREREVALSDLAGCLCSHEHQDHAKSVRDLLKAGVDCWMSEGTAKVLGVGSFMCGHHRVHILQERVLETIPDKTGWLVVPFKVEHDAQEPYGFFVSLGEDRFLFTPDTSFVQNRFHGITLAAVECNHIAEILSRNILEGNIPAIVGKRVRRNHMSLENLITMLKANDLSRCREVWLLHLSDGNSDEIRMKKEIQKATGVPVYIAEE